MKHPACTDQGRFLDVARQTGQKNRGGGDSGRPGLPMKALWSAILPFVIASDALAKSLLVILRI